MNQVYDQKEKLLFTWTCSGNTIKVIKKITCFNSFIYVLLVTNKEKHASMCTLSYQQTLRSWQVPSESQSHTCIARLTDASAKDLLNVVRRHLTRVQILFRVPEADAQLLLSLQ